MSIIDNIITEKMIRQKMVPVAALMGGFALLPGAVLTDILRDKNITITISLRFQAPS